MTLVERLRGIYADDSYATVGEVVNEAADLIEELEKVVEAARALRLAMVAANVLMPPELGAAYWNFSAALDTSDTASGEVK